MKPLAMFSVLLKSCLCTGFAVALLSSVGLQHTQAQSLTLDFQFDPTSGGGTTQPISSAGQTFTIDVFATVTGTVGNNPTNAQLQQLGIQLLRFAARSSVTGGGAFAVGSGSTIGGNAGVGITAAATIQNPFNNPGQVGPVGDFNGDGINDLGGATKTTLSIAQNSSGTQFGGGSFGSQVGAADSWRWLLETFTITVGSTAGMSGRTIFTPTIVGTGASTWTTDGATTADNIANFTPGTPINFFGKPNGSASWNLNGNGNYSDLPNWAPNQIPGSAGLVATFGNGTTNTVNVPNVTVTVNAPERVGTVNFNNTNGTSFTLGNDGVAGDSLTLDNSGAGANINSLTGNNWIFSNLVLADNATFNVAAGSSVLVSLGNISETGTSRSVTKTGAGTLTIDTASTYTGTTSVTAGTLVTTATGTLSAGPLVASAASGVTSLVSLNNNQTVSSLSGTVSGGGVATVSVASGTTLTVAQSTDTTFGGKLSLASSGGTLVKSGSGRLETQGAPALGSGSVINVTGGTLRFNAASGAATIGSGVIATVSGTAVLELAGSVSALSSSGSPADRVNIANNSTAAAGLLVSGTNQQVGKIDGPGVTSVAAGGSLTANHIVESALVIGGTAGAPATVTIAASDASGNSLAESSGFASTNSLSSTAPSSAGTLSPSSLLAAGGAPTSGPNLAGASVGGTDLGASSAAVPEPPALVLLVLGCVLAICLRKQLPTTKLQ